MQRENILNKLSSYRGADSSEENFRLELIAFINGNENCFDSTHPPVQEGDTESKMGHITGSAWVLSSDRRKVLLTHHLKLNKWLQLGGHSDGHPNVLETAIREACEESGIDSISPVHNNIFDIDIHEIPGKGNSPSHFHYDVRFLLESTKTEEFVTSHESQELKWINLKDVPKYNPDRSIERMCEKWNQLIY
jgi:8-oxo-dGTP pyrophosphatase MutT (NUDIX family)